MAQTEYKLGNTRYAYDPSTGQGTAFSNEAERAKVFTNPMGDVPDLPVDPSSLNQNPNKGVSIKTSTLETAPTTLDIESRLKDFETKQDSLVNDIKSYYTPTDTETSLKNTINNLDTSYEQGQNQIEDQVIPMPFITGQQASNERRYTAKRNSYVNQLNSETASRQQKLEAAKFLYDANKNSLNDTIALYKATAPENVSTSVDEKTGNVQVITRNPLTGEVVTSNAGNVRATSAFYKFDNDPTVYTRDGKPISTKDEYVNAGGMGDFSDVQVIKVTNPQEEQMVIDLATKYPDAGITVDDDLSTAQQKLKSSSIYRNSVRLLSGTGGGGGSGTTTTNTNDYAGLSTAQKSEIMDIETLSTMADETLALGERIGFSGTGGMFQGTIKQFFAKNFGSGTQEEEELRNYIGNIRGTLAKLRGGTSFTANEEKLLDSYTPNINDSPLTIKSKLASLQSFLSMKKNSIMTVAGKAVTPTQTTTQQPNRPTETTKQSTKTSTGFWSTVGNWLWGND